MNDSSLPSESKISYRAVFSKLESLPPLSQNLGRLLALIRNDAASSTELEEILRCDEVLSGKVLQIANSAYYGVHGRVTSIPRAIMTMGFHEVVSICLCHMLGGHFKSAGKTSGVSRAALWKSSHVAAKMAREMATGKSRLDREEAYTLGLLHDLGLLVMILYFHEEYQNISETALERKISFREAELECGPTHTHIGRWISVRWGLPEIYTRVMTFHHEPMHSPSCRMPVKLIYLADVLACSSENPCLLDAEETRAFRKDLAISDVEWQAYVERTSAVREEADRFWRLLE